MVYGKKNNYLNIYECPVKGNIFNISLTFIITIIIITIYIIIVFIIIIINTIIISCKSNSNILMFLSLLLTYVLLLF